MPQDPAENFWLRPMSTPGKAGTGPNLVMIQGIFMMPGYEEPQIPGDRGHPLRILVVEDESILAEDLKATLIHMGYQVTGTAMTGERAIESVQAEFPDLVLMDIRLGGRLDGIDTAVRIQKIHPVPVIYLTAYADPDLMERAKRTRPYGYLLKPYNIRELYTTIEIAFYRHAADMQLERAYGELDLRVQERTAELKKANTALESANRKLAILNSITRHDIINQLSVLKTYLHLSAKIPEKPEKLDNFLRSMKEVADIIEQQIAFTRDYQDLGVRAASWQKPAQGIRKAVTAFPSAEVSVSEDLDCLEIYADPMLEKVFYTLIDNALRHGGPALTRIRFFFEESDDGLRILAEDDGAGIPHEDKDLIFTKGFGKHTGLGLFLSQEILAITGISITEDGEPGKGARFVIRVPPGEYRVLPDSSQKR